MAGDKIGIVIADQIAGANAIGTKTQVRDGDCTGFFRVVNKVPLSVKVGAVANNLDAVFVGADRAVRAQAIEQALEQIVASARAIARIPSRLV